MKTNHRLGLVMACALFGGACGSSPPAVNGASAETQAGLDGGTRSGGGTTASSGGGTTASSGGGTSSGTTGSGTTSTGGSCLASQLLSSLGKQHLMVGLMGTDDAARQAPFDFRYTYIASALPDGAGSCTSCTSCTVNGASCANSAGGCNWWGCWQWDQNPPGDYARNLIRTTASTSPAQIPMFTYYVLLLSSGASEGAGEVGAVNNDSLMRRYFADWRLLLQQIGPSQVAMLHIEPDFWGYAQRVNPDPHQLPAAVSRVNPTDCPNEENSVAGFGRCLISMARKYAPRAKVGLHASAWSTGPDVLLNRDPGLSPAAEAQKTGQFLLASGAGLGDFVAVETSDRDAGWYQSQGRNTWWDATNATLPDFHQAFAWAKALSETVRLPLIWWQVPVGNMGLPNTNTRWKDNRVDYLLGHTAELVGANSAGIAFGAGAGSQTTPSTDGGNLFNQVRTRAANPQPSGACP